MWVRAKKAYIEKKLPTKKPTGPKTLQKPCVSTREACRHPY